MCIQCDKDCEHLSVFLLIYFYNDGFN